MDIEFGYCQCGCGKKTKLVEKNHTKSGAIKGQPCKFIKGHSKKLDNPKTICNGKIYDLIHDKSSNEIYKHRFMAEKVFGRPLPDKVIVHHHDGNGELNINSNLVICQDQTYHMLLHRRERALKACGNANYRKCAICKKYDDPKNLYVPKKTQRGCVHRECSKQLQAENRFKKKYGISK